MKRSVLLCALLFSFTSVLHAQKFWQPLNNKAYEWALTTGVAVHQPSDNIIITTFNQGIFRSTDDGESWHQVFETDSVLHCIAVRNDGVIFVGGIRGYVFRSADGGATWNRHKINTLYAVSQIAFTASGQIIAGTGEIEDREGVGHDAGDGIFISSDNGETWVKKNNGISGVPCVTTLAIEPGGRIWAGISNWSIRGSRGGLYYSDNNGDSWQFLRIVIDGKNIVSDSMDVRGIEVMRIDDEGRLIISMRGSSLVTSGAVGCEFNAVSTDITKPWEMLPVVRSSMFWMHANLYNLHIAENGAMWGSTIGGNSRGVFMSTDRGQNWERRHDGIFAAITGRYEKMFFAEQSDGTIYAVQMYDNHVYRGGITTDVPEEISGSLQLDVAPNPVGESTVVSFALPQAADVRLTAVDPLGREVAVLADGRMEAGAHRIPWQGNKATAGMHYLVLRAGNGVAAQKAVYIAD